MRCQEGALQNKGVHFNLNCVERLMIDFKLVDGEAIRSAILLTPRTKQLADWKKRI